MTRAEAWFLHVSNLLVGGTGLVYGWTCYFAEPADPFAVVNHPWQPALREGHLLVAPLLVFACGLIWREHVWKRVRTGYRERRKGGLVLLGLLAPMTLSGYLLQTARDELWQRVWVVVHVASSVLWVLAYLVHQLSPRTGRQLGVRG